MKKTGTIVTALLAVLAIVFAILYFTGNGDKANLTSEKDALAAQVESLTADAAKAAEDAQAQITALTGEKDELAKQVETLTADAAKAADDAKAQIETEVAKAKEEAQGTIDELTKKVEELTASLDFGNMDEEGLKGLFGKVLENPKLLLKIPNILKEYGYELTKIKTAD